MHVLYVSPYRLVDPTNGAAASMYSVLRAIRQAGHRAEAITGTYSPGVMHRDAPPRRGSRLPGTSLTKAGIPVVRSNHDGIRQTAALPAAPWDQFFVTHEVMCLRLMANRLETDPPEIIVMTGPSTTIERILMLAHSRNIPVALYLNTPTGGIDPAALRQVDHLLAPSHFLARFYRRRLGLDVQVLGPFASERLRTSRRGARYVTLINPAPEKGVTLLYALAAEARHKLPQARFLVVQGRWTVAAAERIGIPLLDLPNVTALENQVDARRVYARTRVLLYPSYWEEASGRSVVEAQANGIPVVASSRGGLPETLNGGGFLLRVPPRCVADHRAFPRRADVEPWLAILERLLTDRSCYRRASERARRAAAQQRDRNRAAAITLLSAMAAAGRHSHP